VLSQCFGHAEQPSCVRGVSSYQGWKYAWPQHVEMYRKRKRTKTDTLVDTEKIKEQIKQELVAEMRMQNMQMQRWCCHQMVLSPMSNRASPSPATLKSSCAVGDSPRCPLKQRGNPHLKLATKPKHSLPNHAGYGPCRRHPDGPPRRTS
jgi:hypothetical protein